MYNILTKIYSLKHFWSFSSHWAKGKFCRAPKFAFRPRVFRGEGSAYAVHEIILGCSRRVRTSPCTIRGRAMYLNEVNGIWLRSSGTGQAGARVGRGHESPAVCVILLGAGGTMPSRALITFEIASPLRGSQWRRYGFPLSREWQKVVRTKR